MLNWFFGTVNFGRSIYLLHRVVSGITIKPAQSRVRNQKVFFRRIFFSGSYRV